MYVDYSIARCTLIPQVAAWMLSILKLFVVQDML